MKNSKPYILHVYTDTFDYKEHEFSSERKAVNYANKYYGNCSWWVKQD